MEQEKFFTHSETHSFRSNIPREKNLNKQQNPTLAPMLIEHRISFSMDKLV